LGADVESETYTAKPSAPPPTGSDREKVQVREKEDPASTGVDTKALSPAPLVSTAEDAVTELTPAPEMLHCCSPDWAAGEAEGVADSEERVLAVREGDTDTVGEGEADADAEGATTDAFELNTKLDTLSLHAAPPEAPVAVAMTMDGDASAESKGAEMGPSVTDARLKAPEDAVVPLTDSVADSCD